MEAGRRQWAAPAPVRCRPKRVGLSSLHAGRLPYSFPPPSPSVGCRRCRHRRHRASLFARAFAANEAGHLVGGRGGRALRGVHHIRAL